MHIAHILPALGRVPRSVRRDGAGGISSGTLSLAEAQQRAGNNLYILSWTPTAEPGYQTESGIFVDYLAAWNWAQFGRWDLRWILPAFAKTILNSPDILHVHSDPNLLLLSRPRARVFHMRTPVPSDPPRIYERLVNLADAVICNSNFTAASLLSSINYPSEHVHIVHNGADARFFNVDKSNADVEELQRKWSLTSSDIIILFAGALVPEKGPLHAIRALRIIQANYQSNVRLIIVGSSELWPTLGSPDGRGPDYEQLLIEEARGLPVHFAGALSRSLMPAAMMLADIVVVPSLWEEPFGTVVCEAMASSRPVVAYRSGGIVETIVHGETGLLTPRGSIESLAAAVQRLADDSALLTEMGEAGRERAVRNFTWKHAATKLNKVYASLFD